MVRCFLWTAAVACAGLAAVSSVNAGLMVDGSNSTQVFGSFHSPNPNNPFAGLALDIQPNSFRKTILDRSITEAEVERRQVAQVVRVAVKIITKIVDKVKEGINRDKKARGEFTKFVVDEGRKSHPEFNWIACHTKHRTKFTGVKGKDWGHDHHEFDIKVGGTIGYEIYFAREGEFWNEGDGGYLNWAYSGFFTHDGKRNNHVVFKRPPGT
ncbi:hypothetical protein C0995_011915 [Termitomyces sp. Mi166|nr:hypothetical protein C0995_011915 [Termitomyces sp. Mi166\